MKMRNLLLAGACLLATTAMAQATFPIQLTTADGLPVQTSDAAKAFNGWTSTTYKFAEPIEGFRMTVTHCSWQDAMSTSANGSRGYVFFTMGEFYLYDGNGAKIALTADNFTSNAAEAASTGDGGGLAALCDGDETTYFHTTYSTPEADCPAPIGGEYYLEVTFPEPMSSFSFGFQKRSNNANIPSEIILTAKGVEANPFPEYEFSMGEKVDADAIEMGAMYVLNDEAAVTAYDGVTLFPAANLVPGYVSQSGQTAYHVRRTPNVDCIFVPVAAGTDDEGKPYFYLRNYLTGTYVKNTAGFQEQAYSIAEAAKLHIVEKEGVKFLVSSGGINYTTNSQASFVGYQDNMNRPIYFYKANIATKYLFADFQAVIADAEAQLAARKDAYTEADAAEDIAKLQDAIAAAKAVASTATAEEITAARVALESAAAEFLTVQIFLFSDEVSSILDTVEFGTSFGNYPIAQKAIMEALQAQLAADIDGRTFSDLADVEDYIAKVQKIINEFYASKITDYSVWPLHIGDGSAVVFDPYDAHPSCYIYNSPTFFLEEAVEKVYITFISTNTGDKGGGYPCTNWAHLELFDGEGEKIDLEEENISTNALEGNEGSIAGLIDYDEEGNPVLTSYMHTLYSSSKPETGEHYICITFPEPMNMFSFTLISRENGRLVPTEMEIGPAPYHYVPDATLEVRDQVLKAADIDPNKYYLLYGNINVVKEGSIGSGFYSSATTVAASAQNEGAVQFIPADGGLWKIYFPVLNYYLATPTSWAGVSTTDEADAAGNWNITESENLKDAFKIWVQGEDTKYVLQDWSGSMGYYTVGGEGFESDDTDGESDWTIYECAVPTYSVFTSAISAASQLNTTDKFAMWGNLSVVNEAGEAVGAGSGFYNANKLSGSKATSYNLFKLVDAGNGAYKIYFIGAECYLKAPTGWASVETTTDAAEAGAFLFKESTNLKGAFKIYASGSWDKDGTNCPIMVLQDWGDSMGSFPIANWDSDDKDGESDWTIYVNAKAEGIVMNRDEYMGAYTYTYDDYWTPTEIKSFDITLQADPESANGVIIPGFKNWGDIKGTFDGEANTIVFPAQQSIAPYQDLYNLDFMTVNGNEIIFKYDFNNEEFRFGGQVGVQVVSHEEGIDNAGWAMLSKSYVKLAKKAGDDAIKAAKVEEANLINTVIYNMNGQIMEAPVQGINIIKKVYDNGTIVVEKVLVK